MHAAVLRYRVMAFTTGVLIIVLCFVGIPLQFAFHHPAVDQYVGQVHGFLYILYMIMAFLLVLKLRIRVLSWQTFVLLLAGTVPVMTFVVERWVSRRYIAPAQEGTAQEGTAQEGTVPAGTATAAKSPRAARPRVRS